MSDLRAAAERLSKAIAATSDADCPYVYEGDGVYELHADMQLLAGWAAEHILATHAADDGEELSPQFMESLDYAIYDEVDDLWQIQIPTNDRCIDCFVWVLFESCPQWSIHNVLYFDGENGPEVLTTTTADLPNNPTRGQLRRLIAALGGR